MQPDLAPAIGPVGPAAAGVVVAGVVVAGVVVAGVVVAGIVVAGAVVAGRWRRVTVHGESMAPGLQPGDRLLVVPARRLRPGQVVAVPDPRHPARILVKRVASVDGPERTVTVLGDNRRASTDSRHFGPVPRTAVMGRVVYRYAPAERAGRLPPAAPAAEGSVACYERYHHLG